jgi:hypothetical protein
MHVKDWLFIGVRVGLMIYCPWTAPLEVIVVRMKEICWSCLLIPKKGKRDVGYYCNCGPTGHDMEEEHPDNAMYTCDLVLCMV